MSRNINYTSNHSEHVSYTGSTSLANSAAAVTGNDVGNTATSLIPGYLKYGAGNIYINYRAFLSFDLSDILLPSEIVSVVLKLTRYNGNATDHDLYIVASEATDGVWAADYDDGLTGASSYPYTNDLTKYYDSAWTPVGTSIGDKSSITLNTAAISDVQGAMCSGKFKLAIMNQYDFSDTYASLAVADSLVVKGAIYYSTQDSTKSNHPTLLVSTNHTTIQISADMTFNGGNHIIK